MGCARTRKVLIVVMGGCVLLTTLALFIYRSGLFSTRPAAHVPTLPPKSSLLTKPTVAHISAPANLLRPKISLPNHLPSYLEFIRPPGANNDYATFTKRLAALLALPQYLSPNDRQMLYAFLNDSQSGSYADSLKSDTMNVLRRLETAPPELTGELVSLANNKQANKVIRIYAVQHLGLWYPDAPDSQLVEQQLKTIAIDPREPQLAATALLAMDYLSTGYPTIFPSSEITRAALALADPGQKDPLARTTALQICTRHQVPQTVALGIHVFATSTTVPERLAAIAAIGQTGGSREQAMLQQLTVSNDVEIVRDAAKQALHLVTQRQTNPN